MKGGGILLLMVPAGAEAPKCRQLWVTLPSNSVRDLGAAGGSRGDGKLTPGSPGLGGSLSSSAHLWTLNSALSPPFILSPNQNFVTNFLFKIFYSFI